MKNFFKGKIATAVILIATFILAGVAIFTAIRLYQLRQQPVAPNVPSSFPKAAENACSLTFTLTPQTPGLTCLGKFAFKDDPRNAPPVFYDVDQITEGSNVSPGQKFVYGINFKNTGNTTVNSVTITDVLPPNITFVDASGGCTYQASTRTVTCNHGIMVAGGASSATFRVQVSSSAPSSSLVNKAVLSGTGVENSECQVSLNIQPSSQTPTPTPTPTTEPTSPPNGTTPPTSPPTSRPTTPPSGPTAGTPTLTPTPTPTATSLDATPAATAPSLPQSGTDWPTIVATGFGILVIIGSLLLAL